MYDDDSRIRRPIRRVNEIVMKIARPVKRVCEVVTRISRSVNKFIKHLLESIGLFQEYKMMKQSSVDLYISNTMLLLK